LVHPAECRPMSDHAKLLPGSPSPLGATWDGNGTNFAIYSEGATAVELCLVDPDGRETRLAMPECTEHVWHGYAEGVGPGQQYAYRVDGPWDPQQGLRFNKQTRLLDPYAKAVSGVERWEEGAFSYDLAHGDLVRNEADQRAAPAGIVVDTRFDWEGDAPPSIAMHDSVIYEAHVKGLTIRHPAIAPALRGTYGALAEPPIVQHLLELGVTAVELLPIHHFVDDKFLLDRGLANYWGYNTIGFFAPEPRYRAGSIPGDEVRQFKQMVKTLHRAGLEVILDVVYNHTAEGNHFGPTFSLKGIDNRTYYRLVADSPRHYFDYTGTGNSLNVRHPQALRLVMDSLRYWVEEMHVDGFRFDLASTLARSFHEVDRHSSFFVVINQDPVIGRAKLIAEPWDVGEGGYQVGGFPVGWSEWNGKYRDAMRLFWRGDGGKASEVGFRLTGSSDLYQGDGRRPSSSINLITAHDGFTLRDLVSYDRKHNEANGEDNRDGTDDDASWNCGAEGPTEDETIEALRWQQARNFLATLLLSQGTPMICGGDELGRTQRGNNNAYCQDNDLSWVSWELGERERELLEFTRRVSRLRREHPTFRRPGFFRGRPIRGLEVHDILWLRHDGQLMSDEDWQNPLTSSLGMFLAGAGLPQVDAAGEAVVDDDFLLLMNASGADLAFVLPALHPRGASQPWELVLDTADHAARETRAAGESTQLVARSLEVYRRPPASPGGATAIEGAPVSTYRLQLHREFSFADATGVVDYLARLGVGAVYTSPYTHSERGSTHGYNVVDHAAIDPEIGGAEAHARFARALREARLGHILDFVPNHLGVGSGENAWWIDVLENGPASLHADYFDIDWHPPTAGLENRVLLAVLGRQFGVELEDGRLSITREAGSFWVAYHDRRWPLCPRSYRTILAPALERVALPKSDSAHQELASIIIGLDHLPLAAETDPARREERAREKEILKRRLGTLCDTSPEIATAIEAVLAELDPEHLDELLREQNYRLAYWRVATEEINYRRFFDINELAAIRMEDPRVFEATHSLVFELLARGDITGLRLDHTDGLYDPRAYFAKLQDGARAAMEAAGRRARGIYIVAEKILEPGEKLPTGWRVSGTSGYDFLAAANGLWIDRDAEARLTHVHQELTGARGQFPSMVFATKRLMMETTFSAEVIMLGQQLRRIAERDRRARDFTLTSLTGAIKAVIAAFPVYRTYITPVGTREPTDEAHLAHAIELAKQRTRHADPSVFDYLHDVLLLEVRTPEAIHFAMRFQQLTGPVMAKGVEDTAMYRYNRLVCLNEVGCDPARFGETVESFHAHNARMLAAFPLTMTTTTTHDCKRSEDVRARLAVLTEIPELWSTRVESWLARGADHVRRLPHGDAPTRDEQYVFFQTLVGAWPFSGDDPQLAARLRSYMLKAAREAKLHTSWTSRDAAHEDALVSFVDAMLGDPELVAGVRGLVEMIATHGACNSLAQLALKLASPGVPDIYQGSELWDLSLVDPDNRRPVDFTRRRELLASLQRPASAELARELVDTYADGRIKLHVTTVGLRMRREDPLLFLEGAYRPIEAGPHLIAFERSYGDRRLICVAPRLTWRLARGEARWPLGAVWGDHAIELGGPVHNRFTGERHDAGSLTSKLLAHFPIAWLAGDA
jgi:glycogen operon protein